MKCINPIAKFTLTFLIVLLLCIDPGQAIMGPPVEIDPLPASFTYIPAELLEEEEPEMSYAGTYKISHYTPDPLENGGHETTSTGLILADSIGQICAANQADFPIGTVLYIEGYGELLVADTGVRQGVLDVLVADKETAYQMGVRELEVHIVEEVN